MEDDRAGDPLAQELRAAGRKESEGRFTLDLAHALAKLRQYRLAEPYEYALALLSAAVGSGATLFDVTAHPDVIRFQFDGDPFRRDELQDLFSHLLAGRARPAVLDLAAGVHAVLALKPTAVEVESGGHLLTLAAGKERLVEASTSHTCIQVRWRLDVRRWAGFPPEVPILRRRGRLAPLKLLHVDAEPLDLGPCLAFRAVRHRCRMSWTEPPARTRSERRGPVDAVLALGARDSGLTVVMGGVSYEVSGFTDRTRAVVCSEELRPDLSRSGPVQDAAWERLKAFLTEQFADLLAEAIGLPDVDLSAYAPLARRLDEALPEQDARRRPLLELAVQHDRAPEVALRLARLYVKLDLPQQAKEVFPKALAGIHAHVRRTWPAEPAKAVAEMDAAVSLSREAFGAGTVEMAVALAARAEVRALAGLDAAAREDAEASLSLAHQHRGRLSEDLAGLFDTLALELRRYGRVNEALPLHREARSASPDHDRSLLHLATAALASQRPDEAARMLAPPVPHAPFLDTLAEAYLRTNQLPLAVRALAEGLEVRRWPATPTPSPEDHLFLAMVDEVVALDPRTSEPGEKALRRLARLRSSRRLLLPEGPVESVAFLSTAYEFARHGSLDLAMATLRRATHRLEELPDARGGPLHRALLAWQVALLRRLGRAAEADILWARLQLHLTWAPD